MTTRTSSLIVSLIDRVTAPARSVANSVLGISGAVKAANGQPMGFGDRLAGAISRNDAALDRARGRMVDAVGGFYALKAAIGAPVQAASDFQSAMADVAKVVDFGTPQGFLDFQEALFKMSRDIPLSVNGLAEIAAAAGQAGIAGKDLIVFTETAAKIGTAFDISADEAGTALSKLMTGLDLTIPQVTLLSDAMNHLSNAQASGADEILDVVRRVGAQGRQFGFAAEETAAFASAMISSGAQTDVAATSFMNMGRALTRGRSATNRQMGAFKDLGLSAEDVAKKMQTDAVGTTIDVMERLSKLPAEMRAAVSSDLFGDEARALGPLLGNLQLVRDSVGLVADEAQYAGSAFKEFEVRNKVFASSMQRLTNRVEELKIQIGNALMPAIERLFTRVGPLVTRMADLAAKFPLVTEAVLVAAGAIYAFRVAASTLSYLGLLGRGGALSILSAGFNTIGRAAGGAHRAATAAIALQTALAAMNGQSIGTLSRIGIGLRGMLIAVPGMSALSGALAAVGGAIAAISAPAWGLIVAGILAVAAVGGTIYKYWDRISSIFGGVARRLGEELAPAIEMARPLLDWLSSVGDKIGASFQGATKWVGDLFGFLTGMFGKEVLTEDQKAAWEKSGYDIADRLIAGIKALPDKIKALASEWASAGTALIQALWDGMVGIFDELTAWLDGKIEALIAPLKNAGAAVRGFLGLGGGDAPAGPPAVNGARAKGGPISRGGTYWTGERGPELITASRSGYVNPAGSGQSAPASITVSPTIHVTGVSDPQAAADIVMRRLRDETQSAMRGIYADTGS